MSSFLSYPFIQNWRKELLCCMAECCCLGKDCTFHNHCPQSCSLYLICILLFSQMHFPTYLVLWMWKIDDP